MKRITAGRFPLIARPRPRCTPLPQRVADLRERAVDAQSTDDATAATAVFNLSALLASDCGLHELARAWCHRLARVALVSGLDPRHCLEPIVNLARLHIRAGNGLAAWALLEDLFRSIDTRTDMVIDGLTVPSAQLTDRPGSYAGVRSWLWTVLLGTGAHALASADRWDEASRRLSEYSGVGKRMLDGRQITVVAHARAGRRRDARMVIDATHPGEAWENAVTACLALLMAADDQIGAASTALTAYGELEHAEDGLVVFRTRLGLTLIDALDGGHAAIGPVAVGLIRHAVSDGYAARDVLNHPLCLSAATRAQAERIRRVVYECGLDAGAVHDAHLADLAGTLDIAESTIARVHERVAS